MIDFTAHAKMLFKEHPVRLKRIQKDEFLERALQEFSAMGYPAFISEDKFIAKNRNLIVGSLEQAKIILTAHYDTPYRMLICSNTIFPRNMLLTIFAAMPIVLITLVFQFVATFLLFYLDLPVVALPLSVLATFFVLYLLLFCFPNKYNVNDNSSGVLLLFSVAKHLPDKMRNHIAFVLFDNEEKGTLGSYAFKKNYKQINNTLALNFDCVGVGNDIRMLLSDSAMKDLAVVQALSATIPASDSKRILIKNAKGYLYPSDQVHFKKNAACACFKHINGLGLYINKIHSSRDTRLDEQNIFLLTDWMLNFIGEIV